MTVFYVPNHISVTNQGAGFIAQYEAPETTHGRWGAHEVSIGPLMDANRRQLPDGTFKAVKSAWLRLKFAEPMSLRDVQHLIASLETFFCIMVGAFGGPSDVFLCTEERRSIRYIKSHSWYKPLNMIEKEPLLSFKQLNDDTFPVMGRWLDLYGRIDRLTHLYRAALGADIETRFPFLVQALEGLHRACVPKTKVIDPSIFRLGRRNFTAAIPDGVDERTRAFFCQCISSLHNEPSLSS